MTTLSTLTLMDRRRERRANEPGRYDVMMFVWSVPLPHPHMKVFSTSKRDELACLVAWQYSSSPPHPHMRQSCSLVWNLSPSPNERISFVSFESMVFQCNSGREYSNKLRGQSCKGPLNATQHASSLHIYRGSQNIIDIWSDKHGKWEQRTLSTLTRMDRLIHTYL